MIDVSKWTFHICPKSDDNDESAKNEWHKVSLWPYFLVPIWGHRIALEFPPWTTKISSRNNGRRHAAPNFQLRHNAISKRNWILCWHITLFDIRGGCRKTVFFCASTLKDAPPTTTKKTRKSRSLARISSKSILRRSLGRRQREEQSKLWLARLASSAGYASAFAMFLTCCSLLSLSQLARTLLNIRFYQNHTRAQPRDTHCLFFISLLIINTTHTKTRQ